MSWPELLAVVQPWCGKQFRDGVARCCRDWRYICKPYCVDDGRSPRPVGATDPAFQMAGTFMMNPATLLYLRKLKASTGGSYLDEAKTDSAGYPLLLGHRVYCSPSYRTIASTAKVISFGNHRQSISREVRNSLAVKTYIERFAEYGQIGYEGHWQIQGALAKSSAGPSPVQLLVCHS